MHVYMLYYLQQFNDAVGNSDKLYKYTCICRQPMSSWALLFIGLWFLHRSPRERALGRYSFGCQTADVAIASLSYLSAMFAEISKHITGRDLVLLLQKQRSFKWAAAAPASADYSRCCAIESGKPREVERRRKAVESNCMNTTISCGRRRKLPRQWQSDVGRRRIRDPSRETRCQETTGTIGGVSSIWRVGGTEFHI